MDGFVRVITATPDGRIFFGGDFTTIDEFPYGAVVSQRYVAAYSDDGLDPSFPVAVDGPVYDAFATPEPALVVAGNFTVSEGRSTIGPGYLFRVDGDLEIDTGFTPDLARGDGSRPIVRVVRPVPPFDRER